MADEIDKRPDIIISNFLTYNEPILEEMKSESPELGKSVANVVNALFTKYTGVEELTPSGKLSYMLLWSEGHPENNIAVDNFQELGKKIRKAGMTNEPTKTYIKNKILINEPGGTFEFEVRVDNSQKGDDDWDYTTDNWQKFFYSKWPKEYWTIIEDEGIRVNDVKSLIGYEAEVEILGVETTKIDGIDWAKTSGSRDGIYYFELANGKSFIIDKVGFDDFFRGEIVPLSSGDYRLVMASVGPEPAVHKPPKKTAKKKTTKKTGWEGNVYPESFPLPDDNTDNRPSPTQSASQYLRDVDNTTFDTDKLIGLKGNDAEFVVLGNDGLWYTLSVNKSGVARGVKSGLDISQVDENIETAIMQGEVVKDLSKESVKDLKSLLKEKREAMTIFEKSEPEYVELEIEIDDIEEELIDRGVEPG